MKRISKITNSDWTITLVSTMLGIFLGLYFTNIFENRKLINAKENALEQVHNELTDNKNLLDEYYAITNEKFKSITKFLTFVNEDGELITHKDSLNSFKENSKSIFEYVESEPLDGGQIKIKGSLNLSIESMLLAKKLSHIVWDSYKQTNFMTVTPFECLTGIEPIYELQNEVNDLNAKWKETFYKGDFMTSKNSRSDFMKLWKQLLLRQKLLLQFYGVTDEVMKKCW